MRRKRILITGGSGFIGSYLVERLFRQNDIVSFDRIDAGYNVEFLRRRYGRELDESVSFVRGDIRNKADVEGVVFNFKPDIIFHLASVAGVNAVIKKPFETMETNVIGSYNLLQCLRDVPPERLVFTSTSEVYGPLTFRGTEDGFTTQGSPYDFRWSYSTSKLSVEHMCVSFEKECKVPIAIARPFNIYGPRQIGEGAIHRFVVNCLKREQMKIYGEGDQIRAWCYIDDCVDGLLLLGNKGRGIFNIGNPKEALSIFSLALKIRDKTHSKSKIVFCSPTFTDVGLRVPSIVQISKLGYVPKVDLDEGLGMTVRWYKQNLEHGGKIT